MGGEYHNRPPPRNDSSACGGRRVGSGKTACRGREACATIGAMEAQRSPVRRRGGQTMVEYVLAFVVLLGVVFALGALVGGLRSNGSRTLDLVASEYP